MLPTSCVERSYFSFSGAFMALVYPPHSFGEIRVVGGDELPDRSPQELKLFFRRAFCGGHFVGQVEIEAGLGPDIACLVDAFQPEALLVFLPREKRLAGDERLRVAARRGKLDLG